MTRAVDDVIRSLPSPAAARLPAPAYTARDGPRVGLAVESMRSHTSDEGVQIFDALRHAGYTLHGHGIGPGLTDVWKILHRECPAVVVMQDKREWEGHTAGKGHDPRERFTSVGAMRDCPAFRGTIIKDAHQQPAYHRASADEIGAHFHVCYYHPRIVNHLASYTRPEHLVRTWHTVDANAVPPFSADGRDGCILSGAVSSVYPLRSRLISNVGALHKTTHHRHPGYGRTHNHTPEFLKTLSRYKVAICTSSMFGYSLRKLVEAIACGCTVITDLPTDDPLPVVDDALIRVSPSITLREMSSLIKRECDGYNAERRGHFANLARDYFDYRAEGIRLAASIESLRRTYSP